MATTTQTAGTGANDASVGTIAWTSPGNITADDASNASASDIGGGTTNYIKATNFGFAIAADQGLDQVEFTFQRSDSANTTTDSRISMVIGGTIQTENQSAGATWPAIEEDKVFTFTTGLPTRAQVNASDFGVVLSAVLDASSLAGIDVVTCTVTHSTVASGYTNLPLMGVG